MFTVFGPMSASKYFTSLWSELLVLMLAPESSLKKSALSSQFLNWHFRIRNGVSGFPVPELLNRSGYFYLM